MDMGMEGMGLQHKKRLAQDHIDSLRSALQRLSTTFLPPDAPTDSPTRTQRLYDLEINT